MRFSRSKSTTSLIGAAGAMVMRVLVITSLIRMMYSNFLHPRDTSGKLIGDHFALEAGRLIAKV
jgi:hypothetical protein